MASELYNGWYISANQYDIGPSSGTATTEQKHNVDLIFQTLSNLGWTNNAIAGLLGNAMYESCLDPACVYPKSSFPNGGASIADLDNSYAIDITTSAYGLLQWLGTTTTPPAGNQLVSYAIRHDKQWYDGDIQMARLSWEYSANQKFHAQTVDGVYWDFATYASSTTDVSTLAKVWMVCYEGTYSVLTTRQENAVYWLDYIGGITPTPTWPSEWISGQTFAEIAYGFKDSGYTYEQYDCIGFVNLCRQTNTPPLPTLINGTNSLWRSTRTFTFTVSGQTVTYNELYWKGTIAECINQYGAVPQGALLFKCHPEGSEGYDTIPPEYYGDGIGNFTHVGIYTNLGEGVMQSGGYGGTGVHDSPPNWSWWTHCAFAVYVYHDNTGPQPPEPQTLPLWLFLWYTNNGTMKRKECTKNVRYVNATH